MSFTSAQKAQIRTYLGYPGLFLTQNPRLEGALETCGSDTDYSALVIGGLAELADIDSRLATTARSLAGLTAAVGDADFKPGQVIADLRNLGREWIGRISFWTGVTPLNDYYSGAGYGDDGWMSNTFQMGIFG